MNGNDENEKAWPIFHIPSKPNVIPSQPPTVNVYVAEVNPKIANALIRQVVKVAPLHDLRHVKRIRKKTCHDSGRIQLTAILCLASQNEDHSNDLSQDVQALVDHYQLSPFIAKVCKYSARSKEEWEEQCKLWPTSFHPPTYNIGGIGGFSEEDLQSACNFMKVAIGLANSSDENLFVNAAVIVDPSLGQVIATARDQVLSWHTAESKNAVAACLNPWMRAMQQMPREGTCYGHPLQHAAMAAIESSAARDRLLFPNPLKIGKTDHMTPSNKVSAAKRQKTEISVNVQHGNGQNEEPAFADPVSSKPYLCTGFDIYLVWEPCVMCAMGLVHQRIKRIFYAFPNSRAGALGSVHRLQGEPSLNHHYAVFRVVVPEQVINSRTSNRMPQL